VGEWYIRGVNKSRGGGGRVPHRPRESWAGGGLATGEIGDELETPPLDGSQGK